MFSRVLTSLKVENHCSRSGSNIDLSNVVHAQLWTPQLFRKHNRWQCHSIFLLTHLFIFISLNFLNLKLSSKFFHALQDLCCYTSAILFLYLSQCNLIYFFLSKIIFYILIITWQLTHEKKKLVNVLYMY